MNTTLLIFIIITLHFIGDWVFQPRSRAKSKKTNPNDLVLHVTLEVLFYLTLCGAVLAFYNPSVAVVWWVMSNWILHWGIDAWLPAGKNERQMINYTALDQILHIGCLLLTLKYFIL